MRRPSPRFSPNVGWVEQTEALVGLRSRKLGLPAPPSAESRLIGLRSPTRGLRGLDPPDGEKCA